MGATYTILQFEKPSAESERRKEADDQALRERQAYAKAGGRVFPGQYYNQDEPGTIRDVPPGASGSVGVLLPYDETEWRVGPVPVPRGHQVAVYFNYTALTASFASSGCGGGGAGSQVGIRMGVKSTGYSIRANTSFQSVGAIYGPASDFTFWEPRPVNQNQLITFQPNPAVDLGIAADVTAMDFWLEYAFEVSGGENNPTWGTACYPKGTMQIGDLKLWVHVV
jgi:hypothetical protein